MSLFRKINETEFRSLKRQGKGLYISYGDSPLNSNDPGIPDPNEDDNYNSAAYQVQSRTNDLIRVTKATTTRNPSFWPKQSVLYAANQGPFKNLLRDKLLRGGKEIALGALSTPAQAGLSGVQRLPFAGRGTAINPGYILTNANNQTSNFIVSVGGTSTKNPFFFSVDPTEKRGFKFSSLLGNSIGSSTDLPRKDRTDNLSEVTEENQKGKFVNEDSLEKNSEFFKFDSTASGKGFQLSEPRLNSNGRKAIIDRDDRLDDNIESLKRTNNIGKFVDEETLEKNPELFKSDTGQGQGFKLSEPRLNSNGRKAIIDRDDRRDDEINLTKEQNNTGKFVNEDTDQKNNEYFKLAETTESTGFKLIRKDRVSEDTSVERLTTTSTNEEQLQSFDSSEKKENRKYDASIVLNNRLGYNRNSDYINRLDIQTESLSENTNKQIIPFEIIVFNPEFLEVQDHILLRAYLENIGDNFSGEWNGTKYIGRAEELWNYSGFKRNFSFSFKIAASSQDDLVPLYKKLNLLAGTTSPSYNSDQSFNRGVFTKLTIGDYVRNLPGFFTGVNISWDKSYPWEIGLNREGSRNNLPRVPHVLDISVSYQPVHDFNPAYGRYFIDGAVPRGSVTVEPLELVGIV